MKKNKKARISFIGTAGVPCRYGGFETLAHQLVDHLGEDYSLQVYCTSHLYPKREGRGPWKNAARFFLPLKANGWQSILYDIISIFHAAFRSDVLMIFGVSGAIAIPFVRLFTNRKIVIHIDGLEWKRGKWSRFVRKFLRWSERIALGYSHAHIADNPALQRYTFEKYQKKAWMIPYGGDQVYPVKSQPRNLIEFPFLKHAYVFSVCRIEPENNLHLILSAFSQLRNRKLVIVGNWNASAYGQNLRKQFGNFHNIRMLDPIYDPKRLNLLRSNCLAYVHGHSAGGTNPSLVEAMSLNLPVMAFDVKFNRETTFDKAFFFKDSSELIHLLNSLKLNDYHRCGQDLGQLASVHYTWKTIANSYASHWEELFSRSDQKSSSNHFLKQFPNAWSPQNLD